MSSNFRFKSVKLPSSQSGAALFVSLILLVALTIIGLSAANRSNLQERMANNMHIQNLAINAAESALAGYISESFEPGGNTITPGNFFQDIRVNNGVNNVCYDAQGKRGACGTVYLDGDKSNAIQSSLDVRLDKVCDFRACPGSTMGRNVGDKCMTYEVTGTGTVGNKVEQSKLWVYEMQACGL